MEKNSQNIQLDHPKVLLAKEGPWGRWVFYFVMMALGALGAFGSFLTAFGIPADPARLAAANLVCCLFWLWRRADGRKRWWSWTALGWIVWLLFCVFLFDQALHGGVASLNLMLASYSAKLNYALPVLSVGGGTADVGSRLGVMQAGTTVLWSLLAFPFHWWLSRMLIKRRSHLEAFALTAVFLLLPMGFSILPDDWAFGAVLLFWGALLLTGPPLSGRESFSHRRYRAPGSNAAGFSMLLAPLAVLICMGLVYMAFPKESYTRPELAAQLRTSLEHGLKVSLSARQGQGNGNNRVDLDKLGSRSYTGETMLRAWFQWEGAHGRYVSEKEYLKSFVGSVYTGRSWEQLDSEALDELSHIDLSVQGLPARYGHELYVQGIDVLPGYRLLIENVGANPRCVYIPYGLDLSATELGPAGGELTDDGFAKSANFFTGTKEYELRGVPIINGWGYLGRVSEYVAHGGSYEARPNTVAEMNGTLYTPDASWAAYTGNFWGNTFQVLYNNKVNDNSGENDFGEYEGDYQDYREYWETIADSLEEQYFSTANWRDDMWKAGPIIQEHVSEEQWALLQSVESYTDFVYKYYTQLPDQLAEFLDRYREAFELQPDNYVEGARRDGAQFFAYKIADVFQRFYTYSLDPPRPGADEDFVEFFLDQSHQGYCVHFATAAVALLRSAGYPARYAEGYVVPSSQQGWVDVPDQNAHAWAEVYTAGMGWVPVEVTPASADAPAVYSDATVPDEQEVVESTPVPEEAMPTLPPRRHMSGEEVQQEGAAATAAPSAAPSPVPGGAYSDEPDWGWGPAAGAACASLALIVFVLLMGRFLRVHARKKGLQNPDRNQAALRAYAYLQKLHEWEALCGHREDPPERWQELAEKARFSAHMLTEEELGELTAEADRLVAKLWDYLPKHQRIRCWLEGLI